MAPQTSVRCPCPAPTLLATADVAATFPEDTAILTPNGNADVEDRGATALNGAPYLEDDIDSLLSLLPSPVARAVRTALETWGPVEDIKVNLGETTEVIIKERAYELPLPVASQDDVDHISRAVTSREGHYDADNRTGISGSIHRVTAVTNDDQITGFTVRAARIAVVDDFPLAPLVMSGADGERRSLLIVSPPGWGKSTKLRKLIHDLSTEYGLGKMVVYTDDSRELAGAGTTPHPSLGRAHRLPRVRGKTLAWLMEQAVRGHGARILAVDEIARDRAEAIQAVWATNSGVTLLATAHAASLESLVENRKLDLLLGGIDRAPIKDTNRKANNGEKFTREAGTPAFDICVEIHRDHYVVHKNVRESVKAMLAHQPVDPSNTYAIPRRLMEVRGAALAAPTPQVIQGGLEAA